MSAQPTKDHVPAFIDGFELGECVHEGALCRVFRATKSGLPRPLALKIPRLESGESSESLLGFQTERTIVPALTGPYVPAFVAAGELERTPYLVTEWVEGQTLERSIGGRALAPADVARIGASIADALHGLHQQGVIHQDVKPANVILRSDGSAVLIDFGFAHHARYPDLLAEETRCRAGSAPYVSPEQLLGMREDPRSDLFALGVVLYEALTGTLPFGEPDTDVRNRFWLDPTPPVSLVPDTPAWLQEIVLRCLEPHAKHRYQSAAQIAFDLRHPEQVALTDRARKTKRAGLVAHVGRFLRAHGEHAARLRSPAVLLGRTPIVLVAVDTEHLDDERHPSILLALSRFLATSSEFRLLCLSVIPQSVPPLEHLVRLKGWVAPLGLPAERVSLHAVQSDAPAAVIVELARHNNVDLVIMGAPSEGGRAWSLSVASTVTARVKCSVHVVRVPRGPTPSTPVRG